MVSSLAAFVAPFAKRQPALGTAYVLKGQLALADARSGLLGVDEGKMCATFVISTDDPDRVDDVVTTKGIYLGNFRGNPIAFYGHQQAQSIILPIGKWADRESNRCTIRLEEHRAIGTCYFSQRSKQAADVFDLVVEGILRATSIGFNPMEEPQPRDGRKSNPISLQRGFVFPKVDLLEVSIVGIPAQPTATLVREYLDSVKGQKLDATVRKCLGSLCEPAPVWSNGATLPTEADMSKKWKKAPAAKPCGCAKQQKASDAVEECVHRKIPRIAEDHPEMSQAQREAVAFSMCGEGKSMEEAVKAMGESGGSEGGYTVPAETKPVDEEEKAAAITVAKAPPPRQPQQPQQGEQHPYAEEQPPPEQPPPEQGKGDAKEVLNRLVDALTDYLDLTGAANPAPSVPDEEEEEEDELDDDMGLDDEEEEPVGADRYEFRQGKPRKTKAGKYHKAGLMRRVKEVCSAACAHMKHLSGMEPEDKWTVLHKAACAHHMKELGDVVDSLDSYKPSEDERVGGEGGEEQPDGETPRPDGDEEDRGGPVTKGDDLDLDSILKALAPVEERVSTVGAAWQRMQGVMPG